MKSPGDSRAFHFQSIETLELWTNDPMRFITPLLYWILHSPVRPPNQENSEKVGCPLFDVKNNWPDGERVKG